MKTVTIEEYGVNTQYDIYTFGSGEPRITFTAGIHGNEVSGIYVALRLIGHFIKNPPVKGTVKIIPTVNAAAMRCMQRRSPFDAVDLNRVFPGNESGSISHKLAASIYSETADVLVDLHCCGQHGLPYILSVYSESAKVRNLVSRITMPIAVHSEGLGGQLFTESCRKRAQAACIIEIPSGAGDGAVNLKFADVCFNGLIDMLKSEGVAAGRVEGHAPTFYGKLIDISAPHAGLWQPEKEIGAAIRAGERTPPRPAARQAVPPLKEGGLIWGVCILHQKAPPRAGTAFGYSLYCTKNAALRRHSPSRLGWQLLPILFCF